MSASTSTSTSKVLTRRIPSADRPWLPVPGMGENFIQVLAVDEALKQVVFKFKFSPGSALPRHTHLCQAVAYTISGEWEYEEGLFKTGDLAYEPVGSDHTPASKAGGELIAILKSENDQFLENYMPDGSTFVMDLNFFKMLEGLTPEDAGHLQIPGLTDKL